MFFWWTTKDSHKHIIHNIAYKIKFILTRNLFAKNGINKNEIIKKLGCTSEKGTIPISGNKTVKAKGIVISDFAPPLGDLRPRFIMSDLFLLGRLHALVFFQ